MKKLFFMLLTAGAVMSGIVACEKTDRSSSEPDPVADCWVFVSIVPGEETILLAKSGLSIDEAFAIEADFKSEYEDGNVYALVSIPIEENYLHGQSYDIIHPGTVPVCYEITMTIEFPESSVPSIRDLLGYGFRGVRLNGNIAICKQYHWAFTEDKAEELIPMCEQMYNTHYSSVPSSGRGTIIGTSTIKSIGPEVNNEPIIF